MRFRFCGDLDCPDWVLAEMNSLSRLTSVKMKLLCQEVVKSLAGAPLDYEAVKKLTADAKYDEGDREGAVAALSFVIRGAVRHGVLAGGERGEGEEAMVLELTQLGLPRELAKAIAKAAAGGANQLRKHFRETSLRLNHLESAEWGPSERIGEMNTDINGGQRLKLKVKGPVTWDGPTDAVTSHEIILTPLIVPTLIQDLKRALSRMEEM
ncbi:COMM domain-containing protein 4 [Ischnura elegans]|uniref:COMM domain-containing protein 4 n=1 Tax=Ischnura elegans TaxID=197161 RepID=UPI001ED87219|nr:COMM domain-containing protein 4 [Ischnura elegans]XP_046392729.1 COMM domain-containing protein 4 [Ischnura elegans]XP_046392730.1 COMM domain-containing protein 4 [Ischnura elegans]XP_046392731.1 COMM domain-containing protein 4 [Ischnura elegans]XP_046392732.1 COMM domain-containing protein 4 [Ischnura elegans]